jgi:hypothetical protein
MTDLSEVLGAAIALHLLPGPRFLPFDTDDEAVRRANDTPYRLSASAWTSNAFRASRASREIHGLRMPVSGDVSPSTRLSPGSRGRRLRPCLADARSGSSWC